MDFLSDLELEALIRRINQTIHDRYINNVYSLDELRYSFTLKDSEFAINLHLKIGLWLSEVYVKERAQSDFLRALRDFLEGSRIDHAEVPRGQRIVAIALSSGSLIAELFGSSNLICTDRSGTIMCALREEEFRDRRIKAGEVYSYPKLRGLPLADIPTPPFNERVPVTKHLGFYLAAPRKFIEEIVIRAGISQDKIASELTEDERERIVEAMKEIVNECLSSESLYLYGDGTYSLVKLSGKKEPVMVFRFPQEVNRAFDGFMFKVEEESEEERKRALADSYISKASALRSIAEALMSGDVQRAEEIVRASGGELKEGLLSIFGEIVKAESMPALASKLYELAKNYEAGARRILRSKPRKAEKKVKVVEVRKRLWFEKYRWFRTSEGILAIGGRDASSNEAILRKYMKPDDLVFHAELPGSPFFIISGNAGDLSIKEVATATAAFSRAWKLGLSTADVYYVKGEQISFSAPSGEYMGRGSAMVLGRRNYVHGVRLRLGVGLTEIEGELKVMSAPLSAASRWCDWFVEIEPGRLSQAEAAKRVYRKLLEVYEKVPPLEDFQRALPAGETDIVGIRKRGDVPYI
ncbi:MAG: NFACT RNA binding domain-containing protein [Nitrososphaeria archaeon]